MADNYSSDFSIGSTVSHNSFGEGVIVGLLNDRVAITFSDGQTKSFLKSAVNNPAFFDVQKFRKNDEIKIERIIIKKLFDEMDYDIIIDTANSVSILSAPNGCGKTTIFKFLKFVLSPSTDGLKEVCSIPFEQFSCVLSNNKTISLTKVPFTTIKDKRERNMLAHAKVMRLLNGASDLTYDIYNDNKSDNHISFKKSIEEPPKLRLPYPIDSDEDDDPFLADSGRSNPKSFISSIRKSLIDQNCLTSLDFIEANRLGKIYPSKTIMKNIRPGYEELALRHRDSLTEWIDFLAKADEEMTDSIQSMIQDYNRKLTEAKNKLPEMYIKAPENSNCPFDDFKKRWDNYQNELKKFYEIGILDSTETVFKPSELKKAFDKKAGFLMTYLDAFEKTLEPLQEKYDKLKLFADIFNKRNEITHKTIKFTQNGIKVFSKEREITLECLSSGEKNDFVMFYRLIFNAEKNGIVLIDEPEISLHIEWQEEYIDRLIDICKMNSLQAIIATHSPNIVNGHIDLFVEKR